jgi:hypothetical protein
VVGKTDLPFRAIKKRTPSSLWLIDRWPDRFLWCCKEANTRSPILNRGAVSVRRFNAAVKSAIIARASAGGLDVERFAIRRTRSFGPKWRQCE